MLNWYFWINNLERNNWLVWEVYFIAHNKQVPGYEKGNFIGPTILSGVTPDMECYKVLFFWYLSKSICFYLETYFPLSFGTLQEEIFGPVLVCMEVRLKYKIYRLQSECVFVLVFTYVLFTCHCLIYRQAALMKP